eukprot:CAMPEP_0172665352 /NCGR_PEP_ID=MMETSP1074-20121228/7195_1 /TAXON_ID=2916 /ORGANISM="Ceratium fusus, Strain PA161109" /LENGTH=399 /DNA_ID=CAMNT_0013481659 /DNA_START=49 /DNA_END=1244 /DNA_ORIENTATION=+
MTPEEINFLKLQGAAQVRELSNSLSEVKREIEVLRSHQEHTKVRVQRNLEEQGRRLDNLEREDVSRDTSLNLISKSLEEQQTQTKRAAGMALSGSMPPNQLRSLEDRVDLVEALVRATSLMVTETEGRLQGKLSTHDATLRQALDDECFMLRQCFEQGRIMHSQAMEDEKAARQQLELSVQQLHEMADLAQGARHSLGERLARVESLEQLQKDLVKCSTQTDALQQNSHDLREELTQISQRLENLSNDVAGKARLGHGQTEQIELRLQRLGGLADESQQHRSAIDAKVTEVAQKFESLQSDMMEKEHARAMEYTSLAELCSHLGHQSEEDRRLRENMPRQDVQKELAQSVAKITEESKQHLTDLVKKDSAARVDKLFKLSQRLEDLEKCTQMQEIQNRL